MICCWWADDAVMMRWFCADTVLMWWLRRRRYPPDSSRWAGRAASPNLSCVFAQQNAAGCHRSLFPGWRFWHPHPVASVRSSHCRRSARESRHGCSPETEQGWVVIARLCLMFFFKESRPCQQCRLNMLLLLGWFELWTQYPGSVVPLAMFEISLIRAASRPSSVQLHPVIVVYYLKGIQSGNG